MQEHEDTTQDEQHSSAAAAAASETAAPSTPAEKAVAVIDSWFNDQRLNFGPKLSTEQFNYIHDSVLTLKTAVAVALA